MPELPEVETICRGIKQNIIGKKIINSKYSGKNLRLLFPKNIDKIKAQEIFSIKRRARYVLINLSNNQTMIIHLGMSGKLLYQEKTPEFMAKHDHFIMNFSDGSCIIFNDTRRFGFVDLIESNKVDDHKMIKNLGPEPLEKEFDAKYLQEKLKNKKMNIKTTMMDNKIVVGVGNIYINESLFISKISPLSEARSLTLEQLVTLVKNIKETLTKAIKSGGSTLRDYVKLNGDIGGFQFDFKVYGRDEEKCVFCPRIIKKIRQNGRSTFYCPQCQK